MNRLRDILLCVFLFVFLPTVVFADLLEIRRNANVYEHPSRDSQKVGRLDVPEEGGPLVVPLLQDQRENGYYKIKIPGSTKVGWVYKSLVRRIAGVHPQFQAYKRSLYRHWTDEDGDCQNTRMEVLIRDDDDGQVEFSETDECRVIGGTWLDPYTGTTFTTWRQVDVDHFVPLKNAHDSGGWAWSKQRRRDYANYMEDPNHLLAVSASENRKKGAKGPDQYMPPLASYHCEYVQIWVQIKEDWELEMTEAEGETVERVLANCTE